MTSTMALRRIDGTDTRGMAMLWSSSRWLIVVGLLLPDAAASQECQSCTPLVPVTAALWEELEPADPFPPFPSDRDSTTYTGGPFQFPDRDLPLFKDVDVENGYVMTASSCCLQVWDARGTPGNPQLLGLAEGWSGDWLFWAGGGEQREIVFGVDAPTGDDQTVATVGQSGLVVWDISQKGVQNFRPRALYQDKSASGQAVYSAKIGGRGYAFAGRYNGPGGLAVYDMDAARGLSSPCLEPDQSCPGVKVATVGTNGILFAHGVDGFVATSRHGNPKGVELWNVSSPASPQLIVRDLGGINDLKSFGVALWRQGVSYYLAIRRTADAEVYNVSQCLTSGCSSFRGNLLWKRSLGSFSQGLQTASFSRNGTRPVIYFGHADVGLPSGGARKEFLYDMSNPSSPLEIISRNPDGTVKTTSVGGQTIDYWGWYYEKSETGFNQTAPLAGKFHGDHFYRVARTFFDVHRRVGGSPPVAAFELNPSSGIFPGDPVTFTNTSAGLVSSLAWTFQDGTPGSSTATSPTVTFASKGTKNVSLTVRNTTGEDTITIGVVVDDPAPAVQNVTANPTTALVCQRVDFAVSATGKDLEYGWGVFDSSNNLVPLDPLPQDAPTFEWHTLASNRPGSYRAVVTVGNRGGDPGPPRTALSPSVQLLAPPPLELASPSVSVSQATAHFATATQGATEWTWRYGDGSEETFFTQAEGESPSHTYTEAGVQSACGGTLPCTFDVEVEVRNCSEGPRRANATVTIDQIEPLRVTAFQAQACGPFAICTYDVGEEIGFTQSFTGSPTSYLYDWDGDGAVDETTAAPVASHAYAVAGTYRPNLRVRRGEEQSSPFVHQKSIGISSPSGQLSLSCVPSSVQVGSPVRCTASATGCSPGVDGWRWTTTGGSIQGNAALAGVEIQWATPGSKAISVTNVACLGATAGQTTVSVSNIGGGVLNASFMVGCDGLTCSFDATSSTGTIERYDWDFLGNGDFQLLGEAPSFTYPSAGTYQVTLAVAEPGCLSSACRDEVTNEVVVTGAPGGGLSAAFSSSCDGLVCSFDAGASTGTIARYDWDFLGDGDFELLGETPSFTYPSAGSYQVTLAVAEPGCLSSSCRDDTTKEVVVSGAPEVLSAAFSSSCDGLVCSFDASGSTGSIERYEWDFLGNGDFESLGETPSFTYPSAGTYQVALTVAEPGCLSSSCRDDVASPVVVSGGTPRVPATGPATFPAATLLIPYFEVELGDPEGLTTLLAITNTVAEPALSIVTLWTDWSVPTLSFPVYLNGHATQTISLRDVFNGFLPETGPLSSGGGVVFAGCGGVQSDVPLPAVVPAELQALHTGRPSPIDGLCAGSPSAQADRAVGYVTVDVANRCSDLNPSSPGYFADGGTGVASNDNLLFGDYFLVDPGESFAQGDATVHVRAVAELFPPGGYTFYGRYGDPGDNREPLGTAHTVRYLSGGAFDGGTDLLVWRDSKWAEPRALTCGGSPPWAPLEAKQLSVFDEPGQLTGEIEHGVRFPLATQRVTVGEFLDDLPGSSSFGRLRLDLNHAGGAAFGDTAQSHVSAIYSALGRFSVGLSAQTLETVGDAAQAAQLSSERDRVDGEGKSETGSDAMPAKAFANASASTGACRLTSQPAATLLFPYFEVDLGFAEGATTLLAVTNTSSDDVLTQMTFWTDWGVPSLTFPLYLAANAVSTLNLTDVLVSGILPQTGPLSSGTTTTFPGCGGSLTDVPLPAVNPSHLQAWHTGQRSPKSGDCAGSDRLSNDTAVGYVTVDVARRCSELNPSQAGYFGSGPAAVATDNNVLVGDFFLVTSSEDFAQGEPAVHIRADREAFGPGSYTFYGRYVQGEVSDHRAPLGSVASVRYLEGGGFTGGTQLLVWRDSKSPLAAPVQCGSAPLWAPLPAGATSVVTEAGESILDEVVDAYRLLTQKVEVGTDIAVSEPFGRITLDLNHDGSKRFGDRAQSHVLVVHSALSQFSVASPAVVTGLVCGAP